MTATIQDLAAWVEAGWAIFPCHSIVNGVCTCPAGADCDSPGKHPRTFNGVKGASKDLDVVTGWLGRYPGANWAVATGEPSGIAVIDLDVKKVDGIASWNALLAEHSLTVPETFSVSTGGGGRHLFFKRPDKWVRNRVNWLPGVDVRGDGGYVLLPGSNHISGGVYTVEHSAPLGLLPNRLADILDTGTNSSSDWSAPSDWTAGVDEGNRDRFLFEMACSLRRRLNDDRSAVTLIVLEAAKNCTPPFPEKDAMQKIEQAFRQDHSDTIELDRVPFAAPSGALYEFLGGLDADMVEAVEKQVRAMKVRTFAARVLREERVAKYGDTAQLDGDTFMNGETTVYVPIWGSEEDLLWAEKGGLMIASDQGLGKSLTAQQVIAGRLGVGPGNLLGLPISRLTEAKTVVYLALDRPNQIARSMARLFTGDADRAAARDRLKVWTKPIPIDILGDPFAFADWLQDAFGDNIGDVVIDSVKDLTPANLSNGEVGQALDMAWKECRARGMSTLILHHERKTGNEESRVNRQPSLDNIYGSVWLTSGMDSILHIQGKQGENVVTYSHLKQIYAALEPITAMHDQERGRTEVLSLSKAANPAQTKDEQIFSVILRESSNGGVVTAKDIVEKTGIAKASVDRSIKRLRESGRIFEATEYNQASRTPATYRATPGAGMSGL